ncbi:MAG: hypothetical protein ABJH45_19380 [Paracoccaceae bacterium]
MVTLYSTTRRARCAFLAGVTCIVTPLPALASIVPFEGEATWLFNMEVTEYSSFGTVLSSGPTLGDTGSKLVQSSYNGHADLDFYGPGRHDWTFNFPQLSFSSTGTPAGALTLTSDMPPISFDETELPDNTCGFIIDYCYGALAAGSVYEAVRYTLNINTLIPADALQSIEDPTYPVSFTFTENLIFRNTTDSGDLHFFTATGSSSAVAVLAAADGAAVSSVPVPGAVVSLGSAMFVLAALGGIGRRRPP